MGRIFTEPGVLRRFAHIACFATFTLASAWSLAKVHRVNSMLMGFIKVLAKGLLAGGVCVLAAQAALFFL